MVVKPEQERVRTLLSDTITLLCRNGLTYKSKFNISAIIGITLDEDEVFLVDIRETIKNAGEEETHTDSSDNESSPVPKSPSSRKRKKKPRRQSRQSSIESENENGASRSDMDQNSVASPFTNPSGTDNIKTEHGQEDDDDSQDLVFIKDEPGVTMADQLGSQAYSNSSQTASSSHMYQPPPGDILGNLSQSGQLYATPASSEHISGPSTSWGDASLQQFSSGGGGGLPPGSLSQSAAAAAMQGTSSQMFSYQMYRNSAIRGHTVRERIRRRVCLLPGPILHPRHIQRHTANCSATVIRDELARLHSEGFGVLVPRGHTARKVVFLKPHPSVLPSAELVHGVAHSQYAAVFFNLEKLNEEDRITVLSLHPQKHLLAQFIGNV